uniref:Voltage-dependent calcium channel type A subunit alpha-1 n=1 Tax=Magallana gigas TaxID=29159 RepID=K1R285_MAGGI
MILTIIANCIVLALEEHLPNNDENAMTQKLMKSEIFFLAIYFTEAVLKITSKGFFFGKGAYLKDNWNKLDLFVVVAGFVEYFMSNLINNVDLTLLRMARVFRALKLISGIPHMKLVATTILRSVSKRVCHYEMAEERPCQTDTDGSGYHCSGNTTCRRYWKGPNDGITSFNNIGLALLTANDAKGVWLNWLYFVPLVMFCAFFMMNLVLGILKGVFTREREKMQLEKEIAVNDGVMNKTAIRNYFQWINKGEKSIYEESRSEAEDAGKDCDPGMIRVLYLRRAVESKAFFWGSMACVAANTLIAATEHYNQPQWLTDTQCILEIFFVVLVASVVELIIRSGVGNHGLKCSVFRALRLLRVFEKTRFNFIEGRPAAHFDTFPKAILTVFQIVTGEDWNSVMYNGIRAYGGIDGIGVSVALFFLVVVLFGNYTLLNVFFAIAVDSLAEAKDREDESLSKPKIDRREHGQNSVKRFRMRVSKAVNHRHFEKLVMACIVLSSITLAAEDPTTGHNSLRNQILYWVDLVFAVIFTLEMVLKIIDMGLLLHKGSYLRNGWNCMDCVIVVASLVSLSIRNPGVSSIKIFRILRVLRIFRTINKFPGLKSACVMFIKSIKSVGPLLFIYVLMQVIFAIMAVQLLQGKLFYCNDTTKLTRDQCRGQYIDYTKYQMGKLEVLDREWRRRDFHFDDVFEAMTTLFVITTGEGWPDIFDSAVSSAGVDQGPSQSEDKLIAIFFVVYIVIAPFFFLNVFIAMITVAFQSEDENCILYVTRAEPDHSRFIPKDASWIRQKLWRVVISDRFENLILLLVVLNTICLGMEYEDQPPTYSTALWYSNLAFVIIFVVEAALKIFVLRKNYISDNWNKIDFVIVVGSIIDVVLDLLKGINFRVFRAARAAKILKKFTSLRFLLWSFYLSMKSLPYVFFLNILSFYVFAVLGMQMFGNIKLDDDTAITRYNNFGSIFTSLLVLFRCATGENWQTIMLACSGSRPCEGDNSNTSCGFAFATLYFIVFICLSAFLVCICAVRSD